MVVKANDARVDLRILDATDAAEALDWRMEVLACVFAEDEPWDHDDLRARNAAFIERHLGDDLAYCIASIDGVDAGCGAICFQDELPSPDNPSAKSAYLMNIYTRPEFRGCGVGKVVVAWLVRHARERGAGKVYLETTDAGRPLYESLGFAPMDGMLKLDERT